jgi:calcium-dependent protein kinase
MHEKFVCHRDIKLENVLYDPELKKIKIIDFGISKKNYKRNKKLEMWTITGTLYYRAPEMFCGGGYN